jgi:hypothetical protein
VKTPDGRVLVLLRNRGDVLPSERSLPSVARPRNGWRRLLGLGPGYLGPDAILQVSRSGHLSDRRKPNDVDRYDRATEE